MKLPIGLRAKSRSVILLSFAAVAALGLSGLGGAAAAGSAPAPLWPSQVARPATASCPRGATLIAPTSGWTDALGVSHLTYKADPGLVMMVPPRGLTASRVTPAMMADVGLRAHQPATSSSQRHLVQQVLKLAENRTAPEFCRSRAVDSPPTGQAINDHYYLTNWAGYAKSEQENGSGINGVQGSWTVPRSMTTSQPSAESTWVGIGGSNLFEGSDVDGLIQAGTEMQTDEGYRDFWEYIGSSGCVNVFCGKYSSVDAVAPGDSVFAEVTWESTTSACFYFTDNSRNTSFSGCHPVNVPYDHTSAEWISEWTGGGFKYYDSPGTVSWTNQWLNNGFNASDSWHSPFSGSFAAIIMYQITTAGGISCSNDAVISYPIDAATGSNGGSSKTVTCSINGVDSP